MSWDAEDNAMLTDAQISQIKNMKHDELLRSALSPDMGVLVEVSYRLHRATVRLNGILIAFTGGLFALTAALVYFAWHH